MKRHKRLALVGVIGVTGVLFIGSDSLGEWMGRFGGESVMESILSTEESEEPALFTEWLAGGGVHVNLLPMLAPSEGATGETLRAYADLHAARQDADALKEEGKRLVNHFSTKAGTIERLVKREIQLVDAASAWLAEDRKFGDFKTDFINRIYPGSTEIERYCQRVIRELELTGDRKSQPHGDAIARAQQELRELKRQGGYYSSN